MPLNEMRAEDEEEDVPGSCVVHHLHPPFLYSLTHRCYLLDFQAPFDLAHFLASIGDVKLRESLGDVIIPPERLEMKEIIGRGWQNLSSELRRQCCC